MALAAVRPRRPASVAHNWRVFLSIRWGLLQETFVCVCVWRNDWQVLSTQGAVHCHIVEPSRTFTIN